jgi:poly-gamma-glutamate synthesis protein (capsule biosynthesis protein)
MADSTLTLFLAGDVMTGRGVDQILSCPLPPVLHEPYVDDAREYVRLAEAASGPVPRGVNPAYIWGDAFAEWQRVAPAARIVNLETAITCSNGYCRHKSIHYRMHPDNIACLTGHSSHHPRPIKVYRDRLILYGCGDSSRTTKVSLVTNHTGLISC